MLRDSQLNIEREVDVTVEGQVDGEPLLVSFEVIEHERVADITWVEQMIAKHRYLPTNRLVLVSKSGFSANAKAVIEAQGGWVAGVTPEVVETDKGPAIRELFLGTIQLRLLRGTFDLVAESQDEQHEVLPNTPIVSADDETLGTAQQLAQEILALPWVGRHLLQMTYDHPERDSISHFTLGIVVAPLQLCVRIDDAVKRQILKVDVVGTIDFAIEPLTLEIASMSGRKFASGTTKMLGHDTLWVGTDDPDSGRSKLSFRPLDSKPISHPDAPSVQALAAQLAKLEPPADWIGADDDASDPETTDVSKAGSTRPLSGGGWEPTPGA